MEERKTDRKEISIEIELAGDEFPTHEEIDLRWKLEDEIEERGIGVVGGSGAGGGRMDFSFQVENIDEVNSAVEKVKQLLKEYNTLEHATIMINDVYEAFCKGETPNFQPGDCLSFRFDDGDYGALLVLERGYGGLSPGEELYTLVGVLEYKDSTPPTINVFERRKWLLATHEWRRGKPYNIWLHCFDNAEVIEVGKVSLGKDEPYDCKFFLSWDIIAEYYLREKNRS
jgi:hypothetical protein